MMGGSVTHVPDDVLSAWLEGEVPGQMRTHIGDHLSRCERCRGEVARLQTVIHAAKDGPAEWPGKAEAWKALALRLTTASVGSQRQTSARADRTSPRRYGAWRWPAVGVAAAAALAAVVLMSKPDRSEPGTAEVEALLLADQGVRLTLAGVTGQSEWATPSARRAIAAASQEIDRGVHAVRRALRDRPGDPVLAEALSRTIQQRAALLRETAQ